MHMMLCTEQRLCLTFDLHDAAGKSFFKKKKVPIPVNLQTKDWSAQIQKALSGTYLNKNGGNCLSIRYTHSN